MRIAIGIDSDHEQVKTTIDFLAGMRVPKSQCDLVYVIESLGKADSLLGISSFMDNANGLNFLEYQKKIGNDALDFAEEIAANYDLPSYRHLFSGQIANRLISFVKDSKADMLALSSSGKGSLEGILIGSVGRKAVINCPQSVLIAKGNVPQKRKLKAVFATDHSQYSKKCAQLLAHFNPQGFHEIVVASVYPSQLVDSILASSSHFKMNPHELIRAELKRANAAYADILASLNCTFSSRVEEGLVNDVLARIMREEEADLLILGAQGHGFAERMAIGSVSLRQAVTEPKSVLVLRTEA